VREALRATVMRVVLEIPDEHGNLVEYVTATEAPAHFSPILKVTKAMVEKWMQRRKVNTYKIGKERYCRLDELQEVEYVRRVDGGGRPRGGGT
jgi:hypothetical protein